jgi:C_GCAxxG_C_C family probable redox protein
MNDNSKSTEAVENFFNGCNCAQAMLKTFSELSEEENKTLLKIALPFGGGVSRTGNICGAVSGSLMAIGLKYADAENAEAKAKAQILCREFIEKFTNEKGSIMCKELLGNDISTEQGRSKINELGLREKICAKLIAGSSEILTEIFNKN